MMEAMASGDSRYTLLKANYPSEESTLRDAGCFLRLDIRKKRY